MVNYPISVSSAIGNLISDAVQMFASQRGLNDYDLWYHDEPIWLVRKVSKKPTGELLVTRLQVSVFDTSEGAAIKVIPDAYVVPDEGRWDERKTVPPEYRAKLSAQQGILDVLQLVSKDAKEAWQRLLDMLEEGWQNASKLAETLEQS